MALPTKKPHLWAPPAQRPRLLGRYHVLDEMGRNAVGPLYLARLEGPKGFQRWAAIRKIDSRHLDEEGYVQRFYERVREGAKLLHPNVAALFDVGEDEGTPWVAMEYLHGERLEQMIERLEIADTPASWEIAARIIADAADGLHAVHSLRDKEGTPLGLLHGDLAPHSLVLTYEGKTKIKNAFEPRVHGVLDPRKVPYAAPEQIFEGTVDARADVFALGVLLWELLAGRHLFARETEDETRAMIEAGVVPSLVELVEDLPAELDRLVRRALMRHPDHRFASARDLSRELESLLVAQGVVARDDDVGRYMRTLFADRYTEQEHRLQAATEITEVFRRSQQMPAYVAANSPAALLGRALAGIPDLSVHDEEDEPEETELMRSPYEIDEDRTTAERPSAKSAGISGYTDELLADSGPTNPRQSRLHDTDEIPTVTAPQPPVSPEVTRAAAMSSKRLADKRREEEVTLTAASSSGEALKSDNSRLIMPSSMKSEPDITESAIFVAPRIRAPTPQERTPTPPPRPLMPSYPDRPLLPATPEAGVGAIGRPAPTTARVWPPPPPAPPPFTPPPAFRSAAASRGEHVALSTTSLRAVLFPHDRARRITVVSLVGTIGGAILFLIFFAVWRVLAQSPTDVARAPSSATPLPVVVNSAAPRASQSAPATRTSAIPPIPTLDLQTTQPQQRHRGSRWQGPTTTTAALPTATIAAASGKTGFLTVMCKPAACDHVVDGSRDLGGSPLFRQELSAGKHVLTLRVDSTHAQKIVTVDVPDGDNVTIRPDVSQ